MKFKYQTDLCFAKRTALADEIKEKYPNSIPVIIEKHPTSDLQDIDRRRFIVPDQITFAELLYIIRRRIHLSSEKSIFMFVDNVLPPLSACVADLYEKHRHEDGFLYVAYAGESAFGSTHTNLMTIVM